MLAYILEPFQCIQDLGPWSARADQFITNVETAFRVTGSGRKFQVRADGRILDTPGFDLHGGDPLPMTR